MMDKAVDSNFTVFTIFHKVIAKECKYPPKC